jgi:hypothetical protein
LEWQHIAFTSFFYIYNKPQGKFLQGRSFPDLYTWAIRELHPKYAPYSESFFMSSGWATPSAAFGRGRSKKPFLSVFTAGAME